MNSPSTSLALALALALALVGCAHMEAPPGGPLDTKRPYVTAVLPAPNATHVSRDLKAQIAFSEWVAPDAEKGKVYLNPPLTRKIKARLNGNVIEITSAAALDTGTTYVLGLLPSVKDLHGQPLESPLQLVFSTGPKLDSGQLSGRIGVFQGKPTLGAFAALYPRGAGSRQRFQHLTTRNDSVVDPMAQPNPQRERPAYIAPTDSSGRFEFVGVRPGRYGLIGFQDINADLTPGIGNEGLAIGPSVDIAAFADGSGGSRLPSEVQALTLAQYDTVPLRLVEAKWAGEKTAAGKASGTIRLKFNRPPHPTQCLRREAYSLRRLGPKSNPKTGAAFPVQDVCLNPNTGEIELSSLALEIDGQFVVGCIGLRDLYGNLVDSSYSEATFTVDNQSDTSKPEMVFLGPRTISGEVPRLPVDHLVPNRSITVYYPRLLDDSALGELRATLSLKLDTSKTDWSLIRLNHHEFSLKVSVPAPLKGQRLSISLTPLQTSPPEKTDKPALPPPAPIKVFTLADGAKLGSLLITQDPSAYGSRIILRNRVSPREFSRITPAAPEFTIDSLPEGSYGVDYFRDTNGDGLWNPGSLAPWAVQEPYAQFADSVEVKPGGVAPGGVPNRNANGTVNGTLSSGRKLSWPPSW